MTEIEFIDQTIALLNEKGWCQGAYMQAGACCFIAALNEVGKTAEDFSPCLNVITRLRRWEPSLIGFNDLEKTTKKDVIDLLNDVKYEFIAPMEALYREED